MFAHTADYDAAIAGYLTPHEEGLPRRLSLVDGAAHAAPLRRESGPARRALRDRGAARHARPDPAPGEGTLLQQPARHRRGHVGGGLLEHPARVLHHQAHDALRHRARRAPPWKRSKRARHRPRLGVRLGRRLQHRGRRRHRPGDERPLRRGRRGAVVPRRCAAGLRREEEPARRRAAGEPRDRHARLQAGAGRLPGAGPVSVRPVETGLDRRHRARSRRERRVGRPALRLGRGRVGQVERDPARARTSRRSASAPAR